MSFTGLISVEGLDGAGKSTVIEALRGDTVGTIVLREPGGTAVSELMREILKGQELTRQPVSLSSVARDFIDLELPFIKTPSLRTVLGQVIRGEQITATINEEITAGEEVILFNIARAELMNSRIRPALEAGSRVILDRFIDSTIAYQGYGRGLSPDSVRSMCLRATGGMVPDLTIYIRVSPEIAFARIGGRGQKDRIEASGLDFFSRVADGFEVIAAREQRIEIIDGEATPKEVAAAALAKLAEL